MNLSDKVKMLRHIIPENCKSRNVQKCIINNNFSGIYPNMIMALKTLLTIPVRVASAERSFLKLKLIFTKLPSIDD
jgi:hypothetical protein